MKIIMVAPDTGRKWKLEPMEGGLCFKLYVQPIPNKKNRNGKEAKAEWTFTGKYPVSVDDGVRTMISMMLLDPSGSESIECDPSNLNRTFKKTLEKYIEKVIGSIIKEA